MTNTYQNRQEALDLKKTDLEETHLTSRTHFHIYLQKWKKLLRFYKFSEPRRSQLQSLQTLSKAKKEYCLKL